MPESNKILQSLFDRFEAFLLTKNLKQTKQRKIILTILANQVGHTSAEDLYIKVRDQGSNIGFATIYRTLNLLLEGGFAIQEQFKDGRSVFELKRPGEHHDHLICLTCQKVIEFENHDIEALQIDVAKNHKFILVSHTLNMFGYCQGCTSKSVIY